MFSLEIIKKIKNILSVLDESSYLSKFIHELNDFHSNSNKKIITIIEENKYIKSNCNYFKVDINKLKVSVKVSPRKIFKEIDYLQSELSEINKNKLINYSMFKNINLELHDFSLSYELYLEDYSQENSWRLLNKSISFGYLLEGFISGLNTYLKNIDRSLPEYGNGRELSIILPSTMSFPEFIIKLKSLDILYNELCMLTNTSISEYPLQIVKIESGSLWAKIFGHSKVIDLLTNFLQSGAGYIYRKFTTEGKLTGIPRKIESVESILQLSSKLEKQGIDTTDLKDHISKSSVIIAKELNGLLSGQAEITVNNNTISIGDEVQKKLVKSSELLKLEQNE